MSKSRSPRFFRKAPREPLMTTSAAASHSMRAKEKKTTPRRLRRMRASTKNRKSILNHHHHWVFDQHLEGADQLGAERAVDRAMIAGQGHAHHMRDLDLAAARHGPFLAGTDRKDGGVRRVDHGSEMIDPVHAEIGDRSGAAPILLRLELAGPRPRRKILHLARDRRQGLC